MSGGLGANFNVPWYAMSEKALGSKRRGMLYGRTVFHAVPLTFAPGTSAPCQPPRCSLIHEPSCLLHTVDDYADYKYIPVPTAAFMFCLNFRTVGIAESINPPVCSCNTYESYDVTHENNIHIATSQILID